MQNTMGLASAFFEKMKINVSTRLPHGLAGGKSLPNKQASRYGWQAIWSIMRRVARCSDLRFRHTNHIR